MENEAFVNKQTRGSCGDFSHLRELLILDNGSTVCSMTNGEMLENIRLSKNPILMSTNAGSREINLEADLYGFGTVYYDEGQMANILGFAPMVDRGYRIQYDSNIGDKFIVTAPDGEQTTFTRTPGGCLSWGTLSHTVTS